MNKKVIAGFIILLFAGLAIAGNVYPDKQETLAEKGPWRVTHYDPRVNAIKDKFMIYLTAPTLTPFKGTGRGGYPPFWESGTVWLKTSGDVGYPRSSIHVKTKDIPSSFEKRVLFEVWLVNDQYNFWNSVGVFYTAMGGAGELLVYYANWIGAYDRVVVTEEPFYDEDPTPGRVVLEGVIPKSTYYNVQPKQTIMMTDVIKNYS